ncbi:NAD(P)/FAD-dependent oxidoreductase [Maribacter sp. 2307ULW6-5]|uniref:NAD(P)/FAD-dependent oxidoreductase n=1 Tax=Maribacter sp. 2307ULW6-5 TaxID=3386275 RepID=UPI0039BC4812
MLDYMVVGLGLAGVPFCERLRARQKTFLVFDDDSQCASKVAGGLINPVILKRFNLAWRAQEHLPLALEFYRSLETALGQPLLEPQTILRRFVSVDEQNRWFEATEKPSVRPYLCDTVVPNANPYIKAPLGFGKVLGAHRLDTQGMLAAYSDLLRKMGCLKREHFDHAQVGIHQHHLSYKGVQARHLVFADGFGLKGNPFFKYLPMQGSKGEYLIISSEALGERSAIKSAIFILPLGNHRYKVGANYNRTDKTNVPTGPGREKLLSQLQEVINCSFSVVNHVAGVRPTVADRRPLVGRHPVHERVWTLNGFGSHGLTTAPWAAQRLYGHIEKGSPLSPEVDVKRYANSYPETEP